MTAKPHPRTARALAAIGRWARGAVAAAALAVLVVGVPWGLAHFVGWPLPDHLPRWDEIGAVLLGPLSSALLVNVLATLTWLVWAGFVLDLLGCVADSVRHVRLPAASGVRPTRALAAVLVTAVAVAVLGNRVAAVAGSAAATAAGRGSGSQVVATAPLWPTDPPTVRAIATSLSTERAGLSKSVIVRAPSGGVYDSLWRIAARSLGDGRRWPEIFELNRGMPQPYGQVFTRPSLVYPGQELRLPGPSPDTGGSTAGGTVSAAPGNGTPRRPSPLIPPVAGEPGEERPAAPAPATWSFDPAIVGAVLAATGGVLLAQALRRARRRYVPGSGDRHDLHRGPVVRQLRIRHLRDRNEPDLDDVDLDADLDDADVDETVDVSPDRADVTSVDPPEQGWPEDARDVALTLAAARGLGLIGEGSSGACRSLLVTVLAGAHPTGTCPAVIITTSCFHALVGHIEPSALPSTVRVMEHLDGARDAVEQEILRRVGRGPAGREWPPLALVAEVPPADDPGLQSVLDNGAQVGVVGLLLGQWLPGVTAYVGADGTVSATSPGLGEHLRGARLFALERVETTTILDLLQDADTHTGAEAIDILGQVSADPGHEGGDEAEPAGLPSDGDSRDREDPGRRTTPRRSTGLTPAADVSGEQFAVRPVEIRVFGPPRVLLHDCAPGPGPVDITSRIQPRVRELLVFLVLHPAGATREAVAAALWPSIPPDRIGNTMNTSLSRLRRAMESETSGALSQIVRTSDNLLCLDTSLVRTDFEEFDAARLARRGATSRETRAAADQAVIDSYGGSLAEGMSTEWIETARAGIQRDALDAVAGLARILVADDPRGTLDLLEIARAFDPHNEHVYRDIMRLQARLEQPDGVSRTLALLTARLAEIDDRPSPETVELARRLASGEWPAHATAHV